MGVQGRALGEDDTLRIVSLLSETDMSILDIATRMGCSRSVVASINRRWQVRIYRGRKASWQKPSEVMRLAADTDWELTPVAWNDVRDCRSLNRNIVGKRPSRCLNRKP